MAVDVTATASIDRPRDQVAAYLRDPANDTKRIGGLLSARLLTPGPVTVGSQIERVASFLGLAVRRSITRDLRNLKRVLEQRPAS